MRRLPPAGPLAARIVDLARARGGNVVILFGLLSLPMIALTGAAVDYGLATRLETKLQAATDGTALLLCQTPLNTTNDTLNTMAKTAMVGQMGATGLVVDPLVITSDPRRIVLTAHKVQAAYFGKVTGTTSLNPAASSQCATPLPKTFEIALVLDNTGSMSATSGGKSKMQAARDAASSFVDYVYASPAFSSQTRISVVPFAAAVAVDPSAYKSANWIDQQAKSSYHWTNVLSPGSANIKSRFDIFASLQNAYSGWGWAGCLETLPYPFNVRDGAPSASNNDTLYLPMLAPDEPGGGSTTYGTYPPGNNPTYAAFNSYIDDASGVGTCQALASDAPYSAAEGRACKYLYPRTASPTASNKYTGLPNGPNYGCTTKPLLRLTNDTTKLKALINSMAPLGSTNIHEGFMWGWRTLSPLSVFADGAPYASSTSGTNANAINKVIILMTDGENSWTTYSGNPNGALYGPAGYLQNADGSTPNPRLPSSNQNIKNATDARNALDALTAEACRNAKTVNVAIYTIGFSIPSDPIDDQGLALLKGCATSADQFFVANSSDGLIDAFNKIQASIGALRLIQ